MVVSYDHLYKIVLVGDQGVGKTHIISRYIKGILPKNPYPTIGVEFATRNVPLKNGGIVKAQIWDTAGQERYQAITAAHYRRAVGALVVYDITKHLSFENINKWVENLKKFSEPDIVIMIVGNKLDLVENPNDRKVPIEEAEEFCREKKLLYGETSAYTSANIKEVFETLLEVIFNERSKVSEKDLLNNGEEDKTVKITTTKNEKRQKVEPTSCGCGTT